MSIAKLLNYTYDDYKNWEGDWELIDGIPVSDFEKVFRKFRRSQ